MGPHIPSPFKSILKEYKIDIRNWKYADIVSDRSSVYREKLDYIMPDEYKILCKSNKFDIVFSAQVFEHVRKPWVWIKELNRVLKPGGYLITISPVSWPYHEAPIDCWRAHPEGMKALLEENNLDVVICKSECLETNKKIIPGKGMDSFVKSTLPRRFTNFLSFFNYPIEASIDLISIAKKSNAKLGPKP